ncbi:nitrate ABC transporter substrate-binding protein [Paracoccus sp. MKU1]|nr:nitrate ABC transporter substrate-binding protein [Paracoccus sp. MKU1]
MTASAGLTIAALSARIAFSQGAPIRIAVGSDPVFAAFFVAANEKLFEAENVAVDVQTYTDGGEAMNALVAGQVDMACASEPTSILRLPRAELRPLAVVYESGTYTKLVVHSDINDAKQIKKLGVVMGSISEYATRLTIAKLGLDEAVIEFVPSGPPELPALLARGDIDGYFVWEPWPALGVQQGGKIMLNSADVGYLSTQWLTASAALLDSRKGDCEAVLRGLAKGAEIVRNDPERAARAIKAETGIPEATSLQAMQDYTAVVRDFTPADLESYDRMAQFLADSKVTDGVVPYRNDMQTGFFKG